MKKLLTVLAVTAIMICCSFMFACGSVTGTYKFVSLSGEQGGVKIEAKVGEKFMSIELTEDFMTLTLNEDKTAVFVSMGHEDKGTWEEKDGKVVVDIDNEAISFEKDGNKLIVEEAGMKVVLSK